MDLESSQGAGEEIDREQVDEVVNRKDAPKSIELIDVRKLMDKSEAQQEVSESEAKSSDKEGHQTAAKGESEALERFEMANQVPRKQEQSSRRPATASYELHQRHSEFPPDSVARVSSESDLAKLVKPSETTSSDVDSKAMKTGHTSGTEDQNDVELVELGSNPTLGEMQCSKDELDDASRANSNAGDRCTKTESLSPTMAIEGFNAQTGVKDNLGQAPVRPDPIDRQSEEQTDSHIEDESSQVEPISNPEEVSSQAPTGPTGELQTRKYFVYVVQEGQFTAKKECIARIEVETKRRITLSELRQLIVNSPDVSLSSLKRNKFKFVTETYRLLNENEDGAILHQFYPTQGVFLKLNQSEQPTELPSRARLPSNAATAGGLRQPEARGSTSNEADQQTGAKSGPTKKAPPAKKSASARGNAGGRTR